MILRGMGGIRVLRDDTSKSQPGNVKVSVQCCSGLTILAVLSDSRGPCNDMGKIQVPTGMGITLLTPEFSHLTLF